MPQRRTFASERLSCQVPSPVSSLVTVESNGTSAPVKSRVETTLIWTVHAKQAKSQARKRTQGNTGGSGCGKPGDSGLWLGNTASQARTPNRAKRGACAGTGSGMAKVSPTRTAPGRAGWTCRDPRPPPAEGKSREMSGKQISFSLLEKESSRFVLMLPALSTITFYKGVPPIEFLQSRIHDIVAENPWLAGRLVSLKNGLHISCYAEPNRKCLEIFEDRELCESLEYSQMCSRLRHLAVKEGNQCMDKDEALFRVVVIVSSPRHFAIFISFSHILGDGYTFYEIYGMLGEKSIPRAMIFERIKSCEFQKSIEERFDGIRWLQSAGAFVNIILTMLFRRVSATVHKIEPSWVEKEKAVFACSDVPMISTNDVLTSWFFRLVRCDVGLMALNLRNRLPFCTHDHAGYRRLQIHPRCDAFLSKIVPIKPGSNLTDGMWYAGNYSTSLAFQPADYAAPTLIRRSLSSLRRAVTAALPGFFRSLFCRIAVVSNWASFYRDVILPGAELGAHLPYADPAAHAFPVAILFRPRMDALALLTLGRYSDLTQRLCQEPGLWPWGRD